MEKTLALSEEDRAQVAAWLAQSLEGTVDEDAESVWQQEIANRVAELDCGKAKKRDKSLLCMLAASVSQPNLTPRLVVFFL